MTAANRRRWRIPLIAAAALLIVYTGLCYYFSGIIVDFSKRPLEEDRTNLKIQSPADFGLPQPREIRVAIDGGELHGWHFDNPAAKPCAVILSHGHTGTRYGALKYAPLFWRMGCSAVAIDARHHGESDGRYGTYGYYERDDLFAVVRWTAAEEKLRHNQIGLVGESMGAAISLLAAAKYNEPAESRVAFVLADSPYSSLTTILKEQGVRQYSSAVLPLFNGALFLAGLRADFSPARVSPEEVAPDLQSPVLLMHARSDDYTNIDHSRRIAAAMPAGLGELYEVDWPCNHGRAIDTNRERYEARVAQFLREKVPAFGR